MAKDAMKDLFGGLEEVSFEPKGGQSEVYRPKTSAAKDGIYTAVVRFVPNMKDKKNSAIRKFVCFTEDFDGNTKVIESYREQEEKTGVKQCPINKAYWELDKCDDVALKENAKRFFNTVEQNFILAQILEDKQRPDLVGKIVVFQFGQKLRTKYEDERNPTRGKKRNPIHPIEGRPFEIEIFKDGKFPNYDKCKFTSEEDLESLPTYLGKDGKVLDVKNSQEDAQEYIDFLMENSPDLSKYAFKEWDEETRSFVNRLIAERGVGGSVASVPKSTGQIQAELNTSQKAKVSSVKSNLLEEISVDDEEFESVKQSKAKSAPVIEDDEDDEDDIMSGVDDIIIDIDDL